ADKPGFKAKHDGGKHEAKRNKDQKHGKEENKMSVIMSVITGVVVVAIAVGTYMFMTGGKKEVTVPSILGLTLEEAQEKLKDTKFTIEEPVETRSDDKIEAGKIISQKPGANASVKKAAEISVVISTGPETGNIKVPEVEGLTYSVALKTLEDEKLQVVKIGEDSDTIKEGLIIRQSPEKGTMVAENTTVTVYVSTGAKVDVRVPSVEGMTEEKAKDELKTYGLEVGQITPEESSAAEGTVIRQEPSEGSQVPKGTAVNIVVSRGGRTVTQAPAQTKETREPTMYVHGSTAKPAQTHEATQEPAKQPEQPVKTPAAQVTAQPNRQTGQGETTTSAPSEPQQQKTKTLTVSFNDTVGETVRVRIEANGHEIYNKQHNKSEGGTQVQVKGTKDAEVKIYFDDRLVSTKTISFD
ncbi:MAG: PASTA domain-containing protein, partial [Oscillospiraceae bacterium]|nr:PASTA domain-containing protein [Oscillospiraceae bacterium]